MPQEKLEITLEEILTIRESLGLTQVEAGKLLGGGPSAYAKYEAGTVKPAAAAVNLLRLLKAHPEMLDELRGAEPPVISVMGRTPSPFEVNGKDIESLSREDLPELLRRLLTAEAEAHNLPADGIHVAENADAPDGGEDGRVTWEGGPDRTRFLPSRRCQFQLKGSPVQPAQAGREILAKDGSVKDMVRGFLEDDGHYIMLCARSYTRKAIGKREESIRAALRGAGLDTARDRIQFRDAGQIADWTNSHPAVGAWVKEKVEPGIPGPFRSWSHWAGRADHSTPWAEDDRLPKFRDRLLEQAKQPRGIVRVVGPYGIGKSRLTLQALDPAGAGKSISSLVLYADESETDPHAIGEVIQRLVDTSKRIIAVVNHCPPERCRILENMALRESSRLSLITIDNEISRTSAGETRLIKVPPPAVAVIEAIIDHVSPELPPGDRRRLVKFSARIPECAILVSHAWRKRPLAQATDDNLVNSVVLGRQPRRPDLLHETAALLAAFGLVESEPKNGGELDMTAQLGRNHKADDLRTAMRDLADRGVIRQRGRLMHFPFSPISARLTECQWREWPRSKWDEVLASSVSPELGLRAAQRLALINDTDIAREVAAHACREEGPLDGILEDSSSVRTDILTPLAEIDATSVIKLLDRSLGQTEGELNIRGSAEIAQALSKIAFRPDTFEDGARLLLLLAGRSQQKGYRAALQFIGLFPVFFGNTVAGGEERLRFLDEATDKNRPNERSIIVEALLAGLEDRISRDGVVGSHGSRPDLEPWFPETYQEAREYISGCMSRLTLFAERTDEVAYAARVGLGRKLRRLIDYGLIDAVEKTVARVHGAVEYWPEAIDSLGRFLSHDDPERKQALINRVQKLIAQLQPQGLENRGRFLVTDLLWDYPSDRKLTREEQYQVQVKELAEEFIEQPDRLERFLPEISHGQQRMASEFGHELACAADSPLDWLEPIVEAVAGTPKEKRNFSLLCGYLTSIREKHPGAVSDFKKRAAHSPELAPALPMVCQNCGIDPSDIRLTSDALNAGRLHPKHLLSWKYLGAFANVPIAAAISLFDRLLSRNDAEAFRVAVCLLGSYVRKDPGNLDELRPQVLRLAKNSVRHGPRSNGGSLDRHFERIMQKALKKGWQDPGARAVALALAKALASVKEWHEGELIKPVLPLLLSEFTEIVWPVIGQTLASDPDSGNHLKHILGSRHSFENIKCPLILKLPEETLLEWCHEHPDCAPAFAASTLPVLTTYRPDAPGRALHPVLSRLIDEFGDREDVLREVGRSIRMYNWEGWPLTKYYELFLEPLEQLRCKHQKNLVRNWAKHMLRFLHKQIKVTQREAEEREARWDI